MSTTIPEEEFEDGYVLKFRLRLQGRCLWLTYDRDRGAVDLGIRLKRSGTSEVSQTRVWFQLKGLHSSTLDAARFHDRGAYADVEIAHLREWYEAPEVVYLAVWVESVGEFVAVDVRDLVESRWGLDVRWDEVGEPGQRSIRVWIPSSCLINEPFLDSLGRHASMRIDNHTWRGQFLGHRLDPIRNTLEVLEPSTFNDLVDAILQSHEFVRDAELDPADVLDVGLDPEGVDLAHARLLKGRLFGTLRWPFPMSVEYGYEDPEVPREEGQWFTAQGKVTVLVLASPGELRTRGDLEDTRLGKLGGTEDHTVVFVNDAEHHVGLGRTRGLRVAGTPIGLGALSALVLLTPALYRSFSGKLRWQRPVNRYA